MTKKKFVALAAGALGRSLALHPQAISGMSYETVLKGKYPGKAHCKRVVDFIRGKDPNATGIIYLEGQKTRMIEDNDEPVPFRQRRPFFYLTGVPLPDCVVVHELATSHTTLFIPPLEPSSVMWSGLPLSPPEALKLYDVDDVLTTPEINAFLASKASSNHKCVYAYPDNTSDSTTFLPFSDVNWDLLRPAIEECRVVKDDYEVALTRKANDITANAHHKVMQLASHAENECELEAAFVGECMRQGGREMAYHPIVASGTAAATLHYLKNDATTKGKLNILLDAGCESDCYASDVTRTFPISGTFSPESLSIYNIVLEMQKHCISLLHADVAWEDVHIGAHRTAIDGLHKLGILKGDKEDIYKQRTSVAFFPHGLGHYLGLDTHDVGGNPDYNDKDTMFPYLRVRGKVPEGAIVTVEPGIYFCAFIIEPYLKDPAHAKFIDKEVLDKYWDVGGVRIEDNVLVTKDGHDNLTSAVKEVHEMAKMSKHK